MERKLRSGGSFNDSKGKHKAANVEARYIHHHQDPMVSVFSRSEQCTDQPRNERATQPHQGKKQQRGIKAIRGKSVENRAWQSDAKNDFRKRVGKASGQLHCSRNDKTERDDGGKRGNC